MPNSTHLLIQAAVDVLNSGDDKGRDGRIDISPDAYRRLQVVVQSVFGVSHGIGVGQNQPLAFVTARMAALLKYELLKASHAQIPVTLGAARESVACQRALPPPLGLPALLADSLDMELRSLIERHGADFIVEGHFAL